MSKTDPDTTQQILKLTDDWMDAIARRDALRLDKIIADDFTLTGWLPDGRPAIWRPTS